MRRVTGVFAVCRVAAALVFAWPGAPAVAQEAQGTDPIVLASQPGRPACSFGEVGSCTRACGPGGSTTGQRRCAGSAWGPCVVRAIPGVTDICDGHDNDCDGSIDEDGPMSCDDGLACNRDDCVDGSCMHEQLPSCRDDGSCARRWCVDFEVAVPIGGRILRQPDDCQIQLYDDVCPDRCDCNGLELCSPNGPLDKNRCVSPGNPCENDDDLCTVPACCGEGLSDCFFGPYADARPDFGGGRSRRRIIRNAQRACTALRRRGLTFQAPLSPLDPRPIECVTETSARVLGKTRETYGRRRCPEARYQDCTEDSTCDPDTGSCDRAQPRSTSTRCSLDRSGRPVAGAYSCGIGFCNGASVGCTVDDCPQANCRLVPPSAVLAEPIECPAELIRTSDRPPVDLGSRWSLIRLPHQEADTNIQYEVSRRRCGRLGFRCRKESFVIDSCHDSVCPVDTLRCGIEAGTCPPAGGCCRNTCEARTDVFIGRLNFRSPTAILGCQTAPDNERCPPVECGPGDVRESGCNANCECVNPCLI